MRKLIFTCLTLMLSHVAYSQNMLEGTVSSQEDNQALAAVNVYLPGLKRQAVSDDAGHFVIRNLPAGKFKVQISHIGFKTDIRSVEIRPGANRLDVALATSPVEGEEIVVTAPVSTAPEQTAYSVNEVQAHALHSEGALTLTEALTRAPGVTELSTGPAISKPVIRGLTGNRILTVINGFRFDNQQWQDEHGLGLSDIGLDRVEIIKGPASVLYGSDAMGGVLNVLDEKPAPYGKTVGNYNVSLFSTTLGANSDFGLKGSNDDLNWKIRLGGQSHADYLDGNGERVPNTRFTGADFKSDFGLTREKFLTNLSYNFSLYQFGIVEADEAEMEKKEEHFERGIEGPHHTVNYHLLTSQSVFFFGNTRLEVDAGGHWNTRKEQEGAEESAELGDLDMQLNTYSLTPKMVIPVNERGEFVVGLQATAQTNRNHGERILIPDANTSELAAYGFIKQPLQQLTVEGGLRYNIYHLETLETGLEDPESGPFAVFDQTYKTADGSVGLVYKFNDHALVKSNLATGYRAPNLSELASNGLHEGTLNFEIGDPDLNEEKNIEVDFSAEFSTSSAAITGRAYYNKIDDFIYLSPTDETMDGFRVFRFLQSDANLKGLEVSVDWVPKQLGWLDLRSSFSKIIGKRSDGSYLPFMPADRVVSEAGFRLNKVAFLHDATFSVTVSNVFEQDNLAETESVTPAYNLVDLALGGTVHLFSKATEVSLVCKNVFSEVYFDHLSRIKPGSFNDPDLGFNNVGRDIFFHMSVPFEL